MKRITITVLSILLSLQGYPQSVFKTLQPDEMKKDLRIIRAVMNSIHPATYRYNTRQQVSEYFYQLNSKVSKPLTEDRFDIIVAQLMSKIKCGHTYLNYWNQDTTFTARMFSRSFLPFLFRVIEGQIIITHNLSESMLIKSGDEILSINDTPAPIIIDSLLTVSTTDGNHGSARKIANINMVAQDIDAKNFDLFDIYFPLFFKNNFNARTFNLVIRSSGKKMKKISVTALTRSERQQVYVERFGEIPINEKNWSFKLLEKRTAYFRIGDFETWEWKKDYRQFLDSIFTQLINTGVKSLVVDIRGNSGGADDARDEVLSYLTSRPFGCDDPIHRLYRFLTIPDSLGPYLATWDKNVL